MKTTKKTKINIGATYHEPKSITIKESRTLADHIAIAEINKELRKEAMIRKAIICEARILAKKTYTCGTNNEEVPTKKYIKK